MLNYLSVVESEIHEWYPEIIHKNLFSKSKTSENRTYQHYLIPSIWNHWAITTCYVMGVQTILFNHFLYHFSYIYHILSDEGCPIEHVDYHVPHFFCVENWYYHTKLLAHEYLLSFPKVNIK